MRVFVTGGTGFIGSILIEELVRRGHEVVGLIRPTSSKKYLPEKGVELVVGSLESPQSFMNAVSGVDLIFHLAGATKVVRKEDFYRINAEGTRNLLEACATVSGQVSRFVLVSSLAAAGPGKNHLPVLESDPPRPVSLYGKSKLEAERIASQFAPRIPVTIVRPPVVYGPRERDIFTYFKQVNSGFALQLGRHPRIFSLIHVKDLVNGIIASAQSETTVGQTYFLTNANPKSWAELGELIANALGKTPRKFVVPEFAAFVLAAANESIARIRGKPGLLGFDKIREMRERCWVCSGEKAARDFGFSPQIPVERGIQETAKWYQEKGWL